MERVIYDHMAQLDQRHWWYRARREVLADLIRRTVTLPKRAKILEIGCGTGHNLAMLTQFGAVDALELDEEARSIAEKRLGHHVMSAPLPEIDEVADATYDLIGAFDVIEHIEDDRAALTSITGKLKRGGSLVLTVPAHPWLWSAHDTVNHHKRRYSRRALKRLVDRSPLKLMKIGYFNSLLFPLAVAKRVASQIRGSNDASIGLPPPRVNSALERIFAAERHMVGRIGLPPGLSLFAVAKRS